MEQVITVIKSGDVERFKCIVLTHLNVINSNLLSISTCLAKRELLPMIKHLLIDVYNSKYCAKSILCKVLMHGTRQLAVDTIVIYASKFNMSNAVIPLNIIDDDVILEVLSRNGWRLCFTELNEAIHLDLCTIVRWYFDHETHMCDSSNVYALFYESQEMLELLHTHQVYGTYKEKCADGTCHMCRKIIISQLWEMDYPHFSNVIQWIPRELLTDISILV